MIKHENCIFPIELSKKRENLRSIKTKWQAIYIFKKISSPYFYI
jgi:hypothetical protein